VARRGLRFLAAGLLDQAVLASANAAMTLLPLGLWGTSTPRASNTVLTIGLGYLVLGLSREFVGAVLLAQGSRLAGDQRDRLVRHGQAAAVALGTVAALVLLGIWLLWPHPTAKIDLSLLVWLAPFLPVVLFHDAGRYTYLSAGAPAAALVVDLVWAGTQAAALLTALLTGHLTPGVLLASWGVGACAGAATFAVRTRARPWRGDPRRWIAETRTLSGWFTATAVIGQVQVQAVGFVVRGGLSDGDLAVLRSGQAALLQPVQNLVTAMMGLLVPRLSRLAGTGDGAGLRRLTLRLAGAFVALAAVLVAVVVPLARVLLPHLRHYAAILPIAVPVTLQAGIYLVQIPFTAAMRGMHRARLLFVQYLTFATISLSGLVFGARAGGLRGATWGLATGSAAGLLVMIGLYLVAAVALPAGPSAGSPGSDPSPGSPAGGTAPVPQRAASPDTR